MKRLKAQVAICFVSLALSGIIDSKGTISGMGYYFISLILSFCILWNVLALKNWAKRLVILFSVLSMSGLPFVLFTSQNGLFYSGSAGLVFAKKGLELFEVASFFALSCFLLTPEVRRIYGRSVTSKTKSFLIWCVSVFLIGVILFSIVRKADSLFIKDKSGRIILKENGEVLNDPNTPKRVQAEKSLELQLPSPPYVSSNVNFSKGHITVLNYTTPLRFTVILVRNETHDDIGVGEVLIEQNKRLKLIDSLVPGIFKSTKSDPDSWLSIAPAKVGEKTISIRKQRISLNLMKTKDGSDAYQTSFQLKGNNFFVFAYASVLSPFDQEKKEPSEQVFNEFLAKLFELNGN
jgi:hypothetical protein